MREEGEEGEESKRDLENHKGKQIQRQRLRGTEGHRHRDADTDRASETIEGSKAGST